MLLELEEDTLLEKNLLVEAYYEVKKLMRGLDLSQENIHVCSNDSILF